MSWFERLKFGRWQFTDDGAAYAHLPSAIAGEDLDMYAHRVIGKCSLLSAPASTATVLNPNGRAGAVGDIISSITLIPSATTIGSVSLTDGALAAKTIYAGTAAYNADLKPMTFKFSGIESYSGAWTITLGAGCTALVELEN